MKSAPCLTHGWCQKLTNQSIVVENIGKWYCRNIFLQNVSRYHRIRIYILVENIIWLHVACVRQAHENRGAKKFTKS